jgi:vacuolar-type H+-ATPase catalytic subunit A/Vma1
VWSQPKVVNRAHDAGKALQEFRRRATERLREPPANVAAPATSPEILIAFCERSGRASLDTGGLSRSKP